MWLVSGVLLVAFASYVALPFGLAWYLPQYAARHGIRLDVGRVRVDPFSARLNFSGVRVATSGDSRIEWSNVETRVNLAELAAGRLVLDRVHVSEAKLHAGDTVAEGGRVLAKIPALHEEVSVGELVIDDIELATVSEALGHPANVDRLRISSLDGLFGPEGADVDAELSIGNGRSRLHGRLNVDDTGWILNASEIVANDVPLDGLPTLLGADRPSRGRLDGAGPVRLVYSPFNGAFSATTGGRWAIKGLELGLADVAISGARADWNGAAFMMSSGVAVNALSIDGEVGVRELRIGVGEVLDIEAAELMVQVDASQAPEPRLSMEGHTPAVRVRGRGGAFGSVDVQATNLVSRLALIVADDFGVEIDHLRSGALAVSLSAERSIDIEHLELDRVVVESDSNAVSATTGTAGRVDWRGFTEPRSTGTATRLAMRHIERRGNGEFRVESTSAETVEDRPGDAVLRLRDVALGESRLSPEGMLAVDSATVSDTWLAGETSTLVIERVTLDAVERTRDGAIRVASGHAHLVDHAHRDDRAIVGTGLELAGGAVSGQAWKAKHLRLAEVDIETGKASYAMRELALADAAGEGERANASLATLGTLELGLDGHRAVIEGVTADSPRWQKGAGGAQAIEATSVALDTVARHRWRSRGWHLTGVETHASGRATADAASLDELVVDAAADSTTGAQRIELEALVVDGESGVRAASAFAERTYFRRGDELGIEVAGLRADAIDWNSGTLDAKHGAASLASLAAAPVRASFDTVAFSSARLGIDGLRELASLTSASGRGRVEHVLEWSAGALALDGYRAPTHGETTFDFVETRNVELVGEANRTSLRFLRAAARDTRIDASGATVFANAEVDGIALSGGDGHASASLRALRASPLTVRDSTLEIGALGFAGVEGEIGLSASGDWMVPPLPIGTGNDHSPMRIRIREARTAEPDSIIRFTDRTTQPAFTESVRIASAKLRGFDSEAIGVAARFSLDAAGDTFTALKGGGVVVPTLTGTDLDLNATIRGLSLRALSPYARLHLGRTVDGGYADAAIDATIRTSDLEAVADVALREVALGKSDLPAGSSALGVHDSTALDEALGSLADAQGRIELTVPLRGRLDAPGFDFDGLVARALARAALENAQVLPRSE